MRNPFKSLFKSSHSPVNHSTKVLFASLFPRAINIDWSSGDAMDEAVFYQDGKEYIACFDKKSKLIEYRFNHTVLEIPSVIETVVRSYGEIMNVICIFHDINTQEADKYEIIYRDKDLIRFSLLLDKKGVVISVNKL